MRRSKAKPVEAPTRPLLTQEQLDEWLEYWQSYIGLKDWKIEVLLKPPMGIDSGASEGCNHLADTRKYSLIYIADCSAAYRDAKKIKDDPEQTLVHELIECQFSPFKSDQPGSLEHFTQEQAIDAIATGYVQLKRDLTAT